MTSVSERPLCGVLRTALDWLPRLFGIEGARLSRPARAAVLCGFLLMGVSAALSLADVLDYAGADFRNRIVGARALLLGHDPYVFTWQPGMPETLLDPGFDGYFPIHRLTVPPTVLVAYLPFAWMPYRVLRVVFAVLEWTAMGVSLALLTRSLPGRRWRIAFFLLASFLVATQDFWRQHVERGQVYVFHLCLLSIGVHFCLRQRLDSWWAGVAFGLAAALRPPFLVLAPAFLVLGKRRTAGATALTFALGVLLTLPLAPPRVWKHYTETADLYYLATWNPGRLPPFSAPPKDQVIEGYNFSRELHDVQPTAFPAICQRVHILMDRSFFNVGAVCKAILACLAVGLLALLAGHPRRYSPRLALAVMTVFLIDMEYFLPNRWTYVDGMVFLPLALLLPVLHLSWRSSPVPVCLLVVGVLVGGGPWSRQVPFVSRPGVGDFGYLFPLARSILVMGTLTVLATGTWRHPLRRPVLAGARRAEGARGSSELLPSASP